MANDDDDDDDDKHKALCELHKFDLSFYISLFVSQMA